MAIDQVNAAPAIKKALLNELFRMMEESREGLGIPLHFIFASASIEKGGRINDGDNR
jgi:hypothetical protein